MVKSNYHRYQHFILHANCSIFTVYFYTTTFNLLQDSKNIQSLQQQSKSEDWMEMQELQQSSSWNNILPGNKGSEAKRMNFGKDAIFLDVPWRRNSD